MDPKTRSIIIGAIALIFLAAIIGGIFFFGRVSKNTPDITGPTGLDSLPQVGTSPTPASGITTSPETGTADTKSYQSDGVVVKYPASWGLLTCNSNSNFELDPATSADIKGVVCDFALKPVTFLMVNRLSCVGDKLTLGSNQVTKSKTVSGGTTTYRWCVSLGNKNFDITHRVSSSGSRATSNGDFSAHVEQIIKDLQLVPTSS